MATKKIVEPPKKEHPQKAITNILMRILAVFAASGLSVLGAGAVVGIDTMQAVFLADPLGAVFEVDVTELLSNFSELGMDMTDDQREKAQEVIIPVVIASQIAGAVIRRNK